GNPCRVPAGTLVSGGGASAPPGARRPAGVLVRPLGSPRRVSGIQRDRVRARFGRTPAGSTRHRALPASDRGPSAAPPARVTAGAARIGPDPIPGLRLRLDPARKPELLKLCPAA